MKCSDQVSQLNTPTICTTPGGKCRDSASQALWLDCILGCIPLPACKPIFRRAVSLRSRVLSLLNCQGNLKNSALYPIDMLTRECLLCCVEQEVSANCQGEGSACWTLEWHDEAREFGSFFLQVEMLRILSGAGRAGLGGRGWGRKKNLVHSFIEVPKDGDQVGSRSDRRQPEPNVAVA